MSRSSRKGKKPLKGFKGVGGALPTFSPTKDQREMVEFMGAIGIPQDAIARLVKNPATGRGIDASTLRVHFREELDDGATKATVAVAKRLFTDATRPGSVGMAAAIFWMKTRAHWRERDAVDHNVNGTVKHEHTSTDGKRDLSKLTDAELEQDYRDQIRASSVAQRMPPGTTH